MKTCFLFGHADAPESIMNGLETAIENEILNGTTEFVVGSHGRFDRMAVTALRRAKKRHSQITLRVLLAYHPAERPVEVPDGFNGTVYPPIENAPRKIALIKANQYMIKSSDSLICYVCHFGNSRNMLEYAQRQKDISIKNLAGVV